MTIEPTAHQLLIARVLHAAIRVYNAENHLEDGVDKPWEKLSEEQKQSILGDIVLHQTSPNANDAAVHVLWVKKMQDQGYTKGPYVDDKKKIHPNVCPFHLLEPKLKTRARLFRAIVVSMSRV